MAPSPVGQRPPSPKTRASYTSVRVRATVFHEFDVRRFPLDNHVLTIEFEDESLDANRLV